MSLVTLLVVVIILALVIYLVTKVIPLEEPWRTIIIVLCVVILIVYLLSMLPGVNLTLGEFGKGGPFLSFSS